MKVLAQLLVMGLVPLVALLLVAVGVAHWILMLVIVVPAFIWTMHALDDYLPR
jgi:hypothetical protein